MIEAFPLYWPEGQLRVPAWKRRNSQFQVGFAQARDHLVAELGRMGAKANAEGIESMAEYARWAMLYQWYLGAGAARAARPLRKVPL